MEMNRKYNTDPYGQKREGVDSHVSCVHGQPAGLTRMTEQALPITGDVRRISPLDNFKRRR
jgi:hypothetical protein